MSSPKVLFGFHAVGVRLKTAPQSIIEIYYESSRRDARMRQFIDRAKEAGARLIEADSLRIAKLCGSHGHQGVAARVNEVEQVRSLDELLEQLEADGIAPLLLVLPLPLKPRARACRSRVTLLPMPISTSEEEGTAHSCTRWPMTSLLARSSSSITSTVIGTLRRFLWLPLPLALE